MTLLISVPSAVLSRKLSPQQVQSLSFFPGVLRITEYPEDPPSNLPSGSRTFFPFVSSGIVLPRTVQLFCLNLIWHQAEKIIGHTALSQIPVLHRTIRDIKILCKSFPVQSGFFFQSDQFVLCIHILTITRIACYVNRFLDITLDVDRDTENKQISLV